MLAAVGTPATAVSKATLPIRSAPMSSFFQQIFYFEKVGNINFLQSDDKDIIVFSPIVFCWIRKQDRKRFLDGLFVWGSIIYLISELLLEVPSYIFP
jgi:hypothetical protein